MISSDCHYIPLAKNFLKSLRRAMEVRASEQGGLPPLSPDRLLFVATGDPRSFVDIEREVVALGGVVDYTDGSILTAQRPGQCTGNHDGLVYNSTMFNRLTARRVKKILTLLRENRVVVHVDVDVVLLKNPFVYFASLLHQHSLGNDDGGGGGDRRRLGEFDIAAAVDEEARTPTDDPILCTGMLVLRPTAATKDLVSRWADAVEAPGDEQDQTAFNRLLHPVAEWPSMLERQRPQDREPGVRVHLLGADEFPPGQLYFNEWRTRSDRGSVVAVHNNHVSGLGRKIARFRREGLWLVKNGG